MLTLIDQLFFLGYFTVTLVMRCAKASFNKCMMFSFSISNLINSAIYVMISYFFFFAILLTEFVGEEFTYRRQEEFEDFLSLFLPFMVIYSAYLFWSILFLRVAKEVGDTKQGETPVTSELVQESMN